MCVFDLFEVIENVIVIYQPQNIFPSRFIAAPCAFTPIFTGLYQSYIVCVYLRFVICTYLVKEICRLLDAVVPITVTVSSFYLLFDLTHWWVRTYQLVFVRHWTKLVVIGILVSSLITFNKNILCEGKVESIVFAYITDYILKEKKKLCICMYFPLHIQLLVFVLQLT